MRYRIDNGLYTNIWSDKWIPPYLGLLHLSFFFLKAGKEKWRILLILFNTFREKIELDIFFFIMRRRRSCKFFLTLHGRMINWFRTIFWMVIYTVKSGYKAGVEFTRDSTSTEGHSNLHQESRIWNYILNISIQLKIRIFRWNVVLNILPIGKNLQRKRLYM